MLQNMYTAESYPAYSTDDHKGFTRSPMARPHCWLSQVQEQGIPTYCWYIQQVPFHLLDIKKDSRHCNMQVHTTFSQYGTPECLTTDNGPPFASEPFAKFLLNQRIDHITSSPHYQKSDGFIERQVKTIKTSLATATASGKTLDDLLLSLRSTPIGPNLPSPWEILHNCTEHPGWPSHPVDYEQVRNYLLDKKATQKKYHDQSYNVKSLPEVTPAQVLFLSPQRAKPMYWKCSNY